MHTYTFITAFFHMLTQDCHVDLYFSSKNQYHWQPTFANDVCVK